jgi:hypothetical protein
MVRRFPPPLSVEEGDSYFVVKDSGEQKLGYAETRKTTCTKTF